MPYTVGLVIAEDSGPSRLCFRNELYCVLRPHRRLSAISWGTYSVRYPQMRNEGLRSAGELKSLIVAIRLIPRLETLCQPLLASGMSKFLHPSHNRGDNLFQKLG